MDQYMCDVGFYLLLRCLGPQKLQIVRTASQIPKRFFAHY